MPLLLLLLPEDVYVHICSLLCLVSVMQLRTACKSLNDSFKQYINTSMLISGSMLKSSNFMWYFPGLEYHLVARVDLLALLRVFRISPVLPSLASNCHGIFAVVKSATDNSTLGVANSVVEVEDQDQHMWEDGSWRFEMGIRWRTDRSSVVKYFDLGNEERNGDRWIIKTFIEIYLWSNKGLTKIGDVYLDQPEAEVYGDLHLGFGTHQEIGEHMCVFLHADVVTFAVVDVVHDWSKGWEDNDFDEDAKDKTVAALSKTTSSFLQQEHVLKVIRDYVDEQ